MKSGPAGLFEDEKWTDVCFVAKSAPTVSSVNDCTGRDFETRLLAQTGNEKNSSIGVRARVFRNNYALKVKVH